METYIEVSTEDLQKLLDAYDNWSGYLPYEDQLDYLAEFNHLRNKLKEIQN